MWKKLKKDPHKYKYSEVFGNTTIMIIIQWSRKYERWETTAKLIQLYKISEVHVGYCPDE